MKNFIFNSNKLFGLVLAIMLLFSCSGNDEGSSGSTTEVTPSNLIVSVEIVGKSAVNPNGDGSGIVKFIVNATNATTYKINFGDGNELNATSGVNSYTYKIAGTYSFVVNVTAFNGSASTTTSVTVTVNVLPAASSTGAVWSDEFNTDGAPNSANWGYDLGAGGWGNNESQYYTNRSDNVKVENGVLKIIAKKESYQGSNYTSARLLSKGKFSIKYGKIEFRAKLPVGGGTWPALWMLGDNISTAGWPACGEIDIMEHIGNDLNKIHGTLHYPARFGGNGDSTTKVISNATTEFHIYSIDWRADSIKFYIDNQLFKNFTNASNLPFNQKFFLIMNCAVGGAFGGAIDPAFSQSSMEVDYIRVYQ